MTEIIIHIGLHKTGSTSIQRALWENREFLKKNNILVPKTGYVWGANHQLAWALEKNVPSHYPVTELDKKSLFEELNTEIRESGAGRVVISSEDFSLLLVPDISEDDAISQLRELLSQHTIKIVMLFRNQVDYLDSFFNQVIKACDSRFPVNSVSELESMLEPVLSYDQFVNKWASIFGHETIDVQSFEHMAKDGKLVENFFSLINCPVPPQIPEIQNPRLDRELLNFRRHINSASYPESLKLELESLLIKLSSKENGYKQVGRRLALAIQEKYKEANSHILRFCSDYQKSLDAIDLSEYPDDDVIEAPLEISPSVRFLAHLIAALKVEVGLEFEQISNLFNGLEEKIASEEKQQKEMYEQIALEVKQQKKLYQEMSQEIGSQSKKTEKIRMDVEKVLNDKVSQLEELVSEQTRELRFLKHGADKALLKDFSSAKRNRRIRNILSRSLTKNKALLINSVWFDENYYKQRNPDVTQSMVDPLTHYLRYGDEEGRDPSANFSTLRYLSENPDVVQAGINPLVHFIKHGEAEGRMASFTHTNAHGETQYDNIDDQVHMVVIDHEVPRYDNNAGARHTFQYLMLLNELGVKITFLSFTNDVDGNNSREELTSNGIRVLLGSDIYEEQWKAHQWMPWIQENRNNIDLVFIHRPHIANIYLDYCKSLALPVWYMCHDIHFIRLKKQAIIERSIKGWLSHLRIKHKELIAFREADLNFTPSWEEEQLLQQRHNIENVTSLPLYVYEFNDAPVRKKTDDKSIIFIGSFAHEPNVDGVRWLIESIWPKIRQLHPEAKLHIVGKNPPELVKNQTGVICHSYVCDAELESLMETVHCMVVPLRYGAGVKGKVIDALRVGMPLVSTSCGIEGIKGIEKTIMPVDNAEAFINELDRLLNFTEIDYQKMSSELRAIAINLFSKQVAKELLLKSLANSLTPEKFARIGN